MFDPLGKRVLVTGASSGLGAALAVGLAERGAVVGICARRADRLDEVLARGPDARRPTADRGPSTWPTSTASTRSPTGWSDELGGLDVLVNNAGIPKRRWAWEHRPDEVADVLRINVESPIRLTLALLAGPRAAPAGTWSSSARWPPASRRRPRRCTPRRRPASPRSPSACGSTCGVAGQPDRRPRGPARRARHRAVRAARQRRVDLRHRAAARRPRSSSRCSTRSRSGAIETFVPEWFADIPPVKAGDLDGFLQGSVEYTQQRLDDLGRPAPVRPGGDS